jgi:radical SAM family uncharacterized protein/radical SAM-linked protein
MPFDRDVFDALLCQVEKPGRYLGNELGAVRKDPAAVALRFALAFPEVYEIAQSHPGLQILYDLLNRRPDVYAERVYAPWFDFEALLRAHNQPLVSLETHTPLSRFDIVGFSLQYELTYTNVLQMLDLADIPLFSRERGPHHPLIIAGGPCAFNPEPIADFLDAVLLGDGEEAVTEICDVYLAWNGRDRAALLRDLSRIQGVYIPSVYQAAYGENGRLLSVGPTMAEQPAIVGKRVVRDLDTVPLQTTYVVPTLKVVHARPSLEVMRGCVKGCRFCQAGYIYRPLRERDPKRVLAQANRAVDATGTGELSLLSLSTGDYSCVNPVLTELMNQHAANRVALSLPSTRVDALAPSLLEQIRRVRKTGFTLAPEAGTQRLRDIIQKEYDEQELIDAARQIFSLGWQSLKLYFMLGLPGETVADLRGIADLSARVAATGGRRVEVTASVSTFVPKPHTPFQWAAQIDLPETEARQSILRRELQRRRVRFKWHDARASYLEGVFSRGDRRLSELLLHAYRLGCRFDGWTDSCRFDLWQQAFAATGVDPQHYLRRRFLDEALPWDHLSSGVTKAFLRAELARAVEGQLTPDCSIERCTYCGACDFTTVRNVTYHVRGAKGSVHRGEVVDNWAQMVVRSEGEPGSWEPRGWHKIQKKVSGAGCQVSGDESRSAEAPAPTPDTRHPTPVPHGGTSGLSNADEWLAAGSEGLTPSVTSAAACSRMRLTYSKLGRARFIGHLELVDVFIRALRRARIPMAYSQGHHPMPRLRFAPGLPLGVESLCETIDVDLTAPLAPEQLADWMRDCLPEGLTIERIEHIALRSPSVDTQLTACRYQIDIDTLVHRDREGWIDARFSEFLAATSFPVHRTTPKGVKIVDARPLVTRLERVHSTLAELDLHISPAGSVRPSELIAAILGVDGETARTLPLRKTNAFYRADDTGEASARSA